MRKKKTRNREAGYFVASVCTETVHYLESLVPCQVIQVCSCSGWFINFLNMSSACKTRSINFFFLSISVWADVLHLCPVLFSVQEDDSVRPLGHPTFMLWYLTGSRFWRQQCEGAGDGADGWDVSLAKRRHTPKRSLDREAVIPQAIMKCKFQEKLFFITLLKNWSWRQRLICQILIGELLLHVYVILRQCLTTGKRQWLEHRQICTCCTVCSWFVALACGKDKCFWWPKSAETMLHFAHSWSLWDGPVSLSAVAQATVRMCAMALSSYTHFALHILLFQLFFRRQQSIFSSLQ